MNYDNVGQAYCDSQELCDLLYKNPELDITKFLVVDPGQYNSVRQTMHYTELPKLNQYIPFDGDVDAFHAHNQSNWSMPGEYKQLDIAEYVLSLCSIDAELQRVGEELLLYQERNLFDLLRFMKYLVDTLRKNNIVWGVGRGSSVSSYILYLLGVHKINSMYYDLDIKEFLK